MRPQPILPPPQAPRKRRRRRSWLLGLLGFGFASGVLLFAVAAGVVGFFVWKASRDLPDYESLAKYEPPVMTRIHAHDGSLMAEYARERRIFVPINVIPKRVIAAYLSAEDKRFFQTAHRLLKPGGFLVWGNAIPDATWEPCFAYLRSIGMNVREVCDVTAEADGQIAGFQRQGHGAVRDDSVVYLSPQGRGEIEESQRLLRIGTFMSSILSSRTGSSTAHARFGSTLTRK